MQEPTLILLDTHGSYIPKLFCSDIDKDDALDCNINFEDVQVCQAGPYHEWYWEAWQSILDNYECSDEHGIVWRLHQDGDLWVVPGGFVWPDN